jgi:hypothetical protein
MFRRLLIFNLLFLVFSLYKQELILEGIKSTELTMSLRIVEMSFTFFEVLIITFFLLILIVCISSFLSIQVHPKLFESEKYERIAKKILLMLSTGVVFMFLVLIIYRADIQDFGTKLSHTKDNFSTIKIKAEVTDWKLILRELWIITSIITSIIFGIELRTKMKISNFTSTLTSIVLIQEIYHSIKR